MRNNVPHDSIRAAEPRSGPIASAAVPRTSEGQRGRNAPDLPGWGPQRAAAARNQAKILDAARSLLRARDASNVDMRDIATAAGVGVGTLYRRFGDKARLLEAVISEDER